MNRPFNHMLTLTFLAILACPTLADDVVAIRADRVDTVAAGIIQNGIIIVRDGRIAAIGADLEIPDGAEIIDAHNKTVFPGLINPLSRAGLSRGASSSSPHYQVVDELYPHQKIYGHILQAGFTTLALTPSGGTICGQGTVVRPLGGSIEKMVLARSGLLLVDFRAGSSSKSSLKSALDRGKKEPTSSDPKVAPLAKAVKGELPIFIRGYSAADTLHLLTLLKPYDKMKTTLICGPDNIHVIKQLADAHLPVIIPARIDSERYTRNRISLANSLAKAGVKIACYPPSDTVQGHETYLRQMSQLVKAGLDRETAKKAITLHPAQMLGLEYRLGSLEIAKDANILILSGDPLDTATTIERIIIEGKTVHVNP